MARAGGGAAGPGLPESARAQEVARSPFRRAFPERLLCAPRVGAVSGHKGGPSPDLSEFVSSGFLPEWRSGKLRLSRSGDLTPGC